MVFFVGKYGNIQKLIPASQQREKELTEKERQRKSRRDRE